MRIGLDCDGVLANFNQRYIQLIIESTGRDLFPPRPFDIPCWDYPEYYGYTHTEVKQVWKAIEADTRFWLELPPYPETPEILKRLAELKLEGHDIYFVTSRLGVLAKRQTEAWLRNETLAATGYYGTHLTPDTVLISSEKGLVAHALDLDLYIDDRFENAIDVHYTTANTLSFLLDRPWNAHRTAPLGVIRVYSVLDFLQMVKSP